MDKNTLANILTAKKLDKSKEELIKLIAEIKQEIPNLVNSKFDELNAEDTIDMLVSELKDTYTNTLDKSTKDIIDNFQSKLSEYQEQINTSNKEALQKAIDSIELPEVKDGEDYILTSEDLESIAEMVKVEVPDLVEKTPEEVRDLLESLKGEERLDVSAIKGLDEKLKELKETIGNKKIIAGGGGNRLFKNLVDTPNTYSGQALQSLRVKSDETGLEYYTPTDENDAAIWGNISGSLSSQTDLRNALNLKANDNEVVKKSDYTPAHSILVQQSGTGSPESLQVGNNTLIGRQNGEGSEIDDLSATQVKDILSLGNVDNTSDLNKPISTATQNALNLKANLTGGNTFIGNQVVDGNYESDGEVRIYGNPIGQNSSIKSIGDLGSGWRGRIVSGDVGRTFLMGTYNGNAWLGAHSWTNSRTGTGAAWSDFYINPDGYKKLFLGRKASQNDPLVTIDNLTRDTTIHEDLIVEGNTLIGTTSDSGEKLQVNGKIKATDINFSGLPTSATGLSAGDVWNDAGTLKIV